VEYTHIQHAFFMVLCIAVIFIYKDVPVLNLAPCNEDV